MHGCKQSLFLRRLTSQSCWCVYITDNLWNDTTKMPTNDETFAWMHQVEVWPGPVSHCRQYGDSRKVEFFHLYKCFDIYISFSFNFYLDNIVNVQRWPIIYEMIPLKYQRTTRHLHEYIKQKCGLALLIIADNMVIQEKWSFPIYTNISTFTLVCPSIFIYHMIVNFFS